jgi:hypothetical protein
MAPSPLADPIANPLDQAALAELLASEARPCLSVYMPTHRRHPENQQDPIRFRHLLKELAASLRHAMPNEAAKPLLEPFEALAEDRGFWNHTLDGLAAMGAPGLFRVFLMQRPTAELAIAADSFHTKPLRRYLQSVERYQVLGLSLNTVHLFEGDRNGLDEIALSPEVPKSATDLPGGAAESHSDTAAQNHAERFFRAVDRAVLEHHSRRTGMPLMLAALPEHQHLFRELSRNPFLMTAGLMQNPATLSGDDLRQRAWEIALPEHQAKQAAWADSFAVARAKGLGSDELTEVARAAVAGRVATLLIEAERELPGRVDTDTGRIDPAELDNPRIDDVLDDLGALVEKMGGEVHVLSGERMPGSTGVAATFRH